MRQRDSSRGRIVALDEMVRALAEITLVRVFSPDCSPTTFRVRHDPSTCRTNIGPSITQRANWSKNSRSSASTAAPSDHVALASSARWRERR